MVSISPLPSPEAILDVLNDAFEDYQLALTTGGSLSGESLGNPLEITITDEDDEPVERHTLRSLVIELLEGELSHDPIDGDEDRRAVIRALANAESEFRQLADAMQAQIYLIKSRTQS